MIAPATRPRTGSHQRAIVARQRRPRSISCSASRSRSRSRLSGQPSSSRRHPSRSPFPLSGQTVVERDLRLPAELARGCASCRRGCGAGRRAPAVPRAARASGPTRARGSRSRRASMPPRRRRRCTSRRRRPSPAAIAATTSADVRPAARLAAVAVEVERPALGESKSHAREGHVRALPRAEGVEVAQDDDVEPEAPRICPGEVLARQLGDPVGGDRPRLRVLGRREALGVAVHGGRGRVDDAHAALDGRLEQALGGEHVVAHVVREDVAEAAHARLRGQMEDTVEARPGRSRLRPGRAGAPRGRGRSPPSTAGRSSR